MRVWGKRDAEESDPSVVDPAVDMDQWRQHSITKRSLDDRDLETLNDLEKRPWGSSNMRVWGKRRSRNDGGPKRSWKTNVMRVWGKRSWDDNNMRVWGKRGWNDNNMRVWGKRTPSDLEKRLWTGGQNLVWGKRDYSPVDEDDIVRSLLETHGESHFSLFHTHWFLILQKCERQTLR